MHWRLHSLPRADEWAIFQHRMPDRDAFAGLAANAGQRLRDNSSRYDSPSGDMTAEAAGRGDGVVSTVGLERS
jgi:hypothetical protein